MTCTIMAAAVAQSTPGASAGFCSNTDVGVASMTPRTADVAARITKQNRTNAVSGSMRPLDRRHTKVSPPNKLAAVAQVLEAFLVEIWRANSSAVSSGPCSAVSTAETVGPKKRGVRRGRSGKK